MLAGFDKPNSKHIREAHYDEHMAFVIPELDTVKLAGPLLDAEGEVVGALVILDVENIEAARRHSADDPYTKAGVWERVEIRAFEIRKGEIADGPKWSPSR